MKNKTKAAVALITLILMMPFLIVPSSALTVPNYYWPGSPTSDGVLLEGENIILEKQAVRFDIVDLPTQDDDTETDDYSSRVNIEYSFYNPTDSDIAMRMAFPVGRDPQYSYARPYEFDANKYPVTVNGEAVEATLRHGYDPEYEYNPAENLKYILDEYLDDGVVSPDMMVTKYTFKTTEIENNYAYAAFDIKEEELSGSCIYLGPYGYGWDQPGGSKRVNVLVSGEEEVITLYVFGEELSDMPEWKFYKNAGVSDGKEIGGKMELISTEETSLLDFASGEYDESLGISRLDWFNMVAAELTQIMSRGVAFTRFDGMNTDYETYSVGILFYEFTVGAGERAVNALSCPIYPAKDQNYEPGIFTYDHLLAAEGVLSTGVTEITVNTSYYLIDANTDTERLDGGYRISVERDKSPTEPFQPISFRLCESESPEAVKPKVPAIIWILLIIFIPIVLVIAVISLIIDGVEFLANKIKGVVRK